ncbi:hypothetical protein BKH42_03680 [Helicobacter sp. 13S00482-2]|uniref:TrbC family F-type conjugative pilus assembly protein n=1 Tax=Helicobacter sp. 13S00482-2 TaxID=1476200 RepID=UPI000BA6B101|nr:TrbC family F-type conjugative pilus assembly protein [Helicobacter sp. 13S00482-2]PAF53842.1 hypothetical protein BKH42_03680 [Helicobacter sp. 13S00482-2]
MIKVLFGLLLFFGFSYAEGEFLNKDIARSLLPKNQLKLYENKLNLIQQSKEKKLTIFYLTSAPLAKGSKNFNKLIEKINKNGKEVIGLIILRGFPKKEKIMDFLMNTYEKGVGGTIKIHPLIFNTFKVTKVPAFALSYCPTNENFAFRDCENKFLAIGDITLTDFFKMVSDYDKNYESYYFTLIEPK